MKVYALFHAALEDDRYLRAVYARRADAESDITADEVSDNWILEQFAAGRPIYGRKEPRWETWEYPEGVEHRRWVSETTVNIRMVQTHHEYCCSVSEEDVLTAPTGQVILDGSAVGSAVALIAGNEH